MTSNRSIGDDERPAGDEQAVADGDRDTDYDVVETPVLVIGAGGGQ